MEFINLILRSSAIRSVRSYYTRSQVSRVDRRDASSRLAAIRFPPRLPRTRDTPLSNFASIIAALIIVLSVLSVRVARFSRAGTAADFFSRRFFAFHRVTRVRTIVPRADIDPDAEHLECKRRRGKKERTPTSSRARASLLRNRGNRADPKGQTSPATFRATRAAKFIRGVHCLTQIFLSFPLLCSCSSDFRSDCC